METDFEFDGETELVALGYHYVIHERLHRQPLAAFKHWVDAAASYRQWSTSYTISEIPRRPQDHICINCGRLRSLHGQITVHDISDICPVGPTLELANPPTWAFTRYAS